MKNKTNTTIIILSVFTICIVGCLLFWISYIQGLSVKTTELKTEVESIQIKIKHIQSMNKSAEKTSEDSIKVTNYFVRSDGSIDFVSMVESVASGFKLEYNTNTIENIEDETLSAQDKQILKISMTLSGGWKNILKFLTYIESLPYAVRVEKTDLAAEGFTPSGDTSVADGFIGTKIPSSESTWRLTLVFSVVKIKEKGNR